MDILKYAWLTIKHKYFVYIAGLKIATPVSRLILHDLSKFFPSELPHYGRQFFGKADRPYAFIKCWVHHQNRNDHHWEYWIPRTGHNICNPSYPDNIPIKMSEGAVKEMVADWVGASRAYNGKWPRSKESWEWYVTSFHNIRERLHKETVKEVEQNIDLYLLRTYK